jgi:hypothetical protein
MTEPGHNPYQAPSSGSEPPDPDGAASIADQVAQTAPNTIVRVAAAFTAVLGLMVALSGLQFAGAVRGGAAFVPYAMMGVGVLSIFLGAKLYQTRAWAAIAAAVLGGLLTLGFLVWVVLALGSGVISFLAVLTVLVAPASAVLAILSVGHCLRATRARERLYRELEQP